MQAYGSLIIEISLLAVEFRTISSKLYSGGWKLIRMQLIRGPLPFSGVGKTINDLKGIKTAKGSRYSLS